MSDKYPRTSHLPWSPGGTKEDRILANVDALLHRELVITEKLDGSNVCLEREQVFARSHNDAPRHPSFDALKAVHAALRWQIPAYWQLFGEWLWARHSIAYNRLPTFLLIFGIRDTSEMVWLSWEETVAACNNMNLKTVPVLWRGIVQAEAELQTRIEALLQKRSYGPEQEGLVVRIAESFVDAEFGKSVAKWVRQHHVQTNEHWNSQQITRNLLAADNAPDG